MRDDFEPCECKARIRVRIELLEQVGHIEEDLPLRLLVEAVTHIEHSEDVDEHAVERLLVKGTLQVRVILVQFLADKVEDSRHELLLVELEGLQQHDYELNTRVNVAVVELCVPHRATLVDVFLGEVDGGAHHNLAEREKLLLVLVDAKCAQLGVECAHLLLLRLRVGNVAQAYPLGEVSAQLLLKWRLL